jgi:hypothetical protein
MTCLIAISLPNLALVGADTRISVPEDGFYQRIDARIGAYELQSGRSLPIPDGLRKIRKIQGTWYAASGDLVTGELGFATFQTLGLHPANIVENWEIRRLELRTLSHSENCHDLDVIDNTCFLIAIAHPDPTVVSLNLSTSSQTDPCNYRISVPPGFTEEDTTEASAAFVKSLQESLDASNLFGAIRAVVAVLKKANERCVTCSSLVQVGFSIGTVDDGAQHFRIEGEATELLILSNEDLRARFIQLV